MLIDVCDAQSQLADLVERAARGEEIVIAEDSRPVARLVAVEDRGPRRSGLAKGQLTDAFFEPLPDDELMAWEP
jgi:prevent-host-death family protein